MTKIAIDGRLMVGLAVTAQLGKVADTTTDQAHASFSRVAVVPAISNVTSSPPMSFDIDGVTEASESRRGRIVGTFRADLRGSREDLTMIAVIFLGLALGLDSFRASLAMARIAADRGADGADGAGVWDLRWSGSACRPGSEPGDGGLCRVVVGTDRPGGAHRLRGIRALERFEDEKARHEGGWAILGVPLCLSLDNLVAGLGLETLGRPLSVSAIVIGVAERGDVPGRADARAAGQARLPASVERLSGLLLVGLGVAAAFD